MKKMNRAFILFLSLWAVPGQALTPAELQFQGSTPAQLSYAGRDWGEIVGGCNPLVAAIFLGGSCWIALGHGPIPKNSGIQAESLLTVNFWGEGKINVSYETESIKGCQGIQKSFIGYQTPFGIYSLWPLGEGNPNTINPMTDKPFAHLTLSEAGRARLQFLYTLQEQTSGSNGYSCTWQIRGNAPIQFNGKPFSSTRAEPRPKGESQAIPAYKPEFERARAPQNPEGN